MTYAKTTKKTVKKVKKKKAGKGGYVRCPECGGDGVIKPRKKK